MKHNGANDAAFPRPCGAANGEEQNLEQDGLTCREWWAGQAIVGILANATTGGQYDKHDVGYAAELAFAVADAMIEESAKLRRS